MEYEADRGSDGVNVHEGTSTKWGGCPTLSILPRLGLHVLCSTRAVGPAVLHRQAGRCLV